MRLERGISALIEVLQFVNLTLQSAPLHSFFLTNMLSTQKINNHSGETVQGGGTL